MHFHEWGKWRTYEERSNFIPYKNNPSFQAFVTYEVRQRRECSVCGRVQDEFIKDGPDTLKGTK